MSRFFQVCVIIIIMTLSLHILVFTCTLLEQHVCAQLPRPPSSQRTHLFHKLPEAEHLAHVLFERAELVQCCSLTGSPRLATLCSACLSAAIHSTPSKFPAWLHPSHVLPPAVCLRCCSWKFNIPTKKLFPSFNSLDMATPLICLATSF